jgi:BirA family biotin operon repressor/biotin-[acetyl-CoA-carboxylase] ligase
VTDRPAERYDGLSAAELAAGWGLPAVHLYGQVGSTNDVARALAGRGAPAGTLVLADEQAAGRGRGGKGWASPPGLGVWMSMVLRPPSLSSPGLLPILVGLAAAEALDPFARPARVMVKWPNDLQLAGRKLAGILCEASWEGGGPSFVVAGIGINVLHAPADFPPELGDAATSLRIAAGWGPPRGEVAGAVAAAVFRRLAEPPAALDAALLAELEGRDALRGRRVRVSGPEPVTGVAEGIGPGGALRVRSGSALHAVTAGTVRPADEPAPSA